MHTNWNGALRHHTSEPFVTADRDDGALRRRPSVENPELDDIPNLAAEQRIQYQGAWGSSNFRCAESA